MYKYPPRTKPCSILPSLVREWGRELRATRWKGWQPQISRTKPQHNATYQRLPPGGSWRRRRLKESARAFNKNRLPSIPKDPQAPSVELHRNSCTIPPGGRLTVRTKPSPKPSPFGKGDESCEQLDG